MTVKTLSLVLVTALAGAAAGYFLACRQPVGSEPRAAAKSERKIAFYQSPMHPWIKSDKPGKCTICGMQMVPVYEGEAGMSGDKNLVTLSATSVSVVGVRTSEVTRGVWVKTLRVTGVLDDDETKHQILSAHVPGRIEKLLVNEVGAQVKEGEPLAVLYSPEIQTAQRQYVEFYRAGLNAFPASERADARERLLAMGMLSEDIERLEKTQEPEATVLVHAHAGGTIISRAAYVGQYVNTHDRIFEVGDFSTLWFVFDAYEPDLAFLRVGQTVEISTPSRPGVSVTAPITFIDPNLNELTRTARVRVVVDNADGRFRHRETATGRVQIEKADTLMVPRSAVLHTRAEPLVFVDKGGGAYEPRAVKLGSAGDEDYEVLEGLKAGERVVTEGALLIDGQSQMAQGDSSPIMAGAKEAGTGPMRPESTPAAMKMTADAGIEALALAAADGSAALASDDLGRWKTVLPEIRAALKKVPLVSPKVAELGGKLVDGPDLKAVRRAFEPFSTAVADVAKEAHLHHRGVVKIFQCPMSPVLGTGRWVQREGELKNPFFGAAMLTCGEDVE